MEEKKLKSAREIAMEKAAKIPGLTPQEARAQKEREYVPRGKAIADRYLGSLIKEADVEIELHKYQGEERDIVRKALLDTLLLAVDPEDKERSKRALQGLRRLSKKDIGQIETEVERVSSEFQQQLQLEYTRFEEAEKERLRALGIAGSAVKPNLEEKEDWQRHLGEIKKTYDAKLKELRGRLSRLIEG